MAAVLLDRLLETCRKRRAYDLVLAPGSKPLLRLASGWHPLQIAPTREEDIRSIADEGMTGGPPDAEEGYSFRDFTYGDEYFRIAAFGYPDTKLVLITRHGPSAPPGHIFIRV